MTTSKLVKKEFETGATYWVNVDDPVPKGTLYITLTREAENAERVPGTFTEKYVADLLRTIRDALCK